MVAARICFLYAGVRRARDHGDLYKDLPDWMELDEAARNARQAMRSLGLGFILPMSFDSFLYALLQPSSLRY